MALKDVQEDFKPTLMMHDVLITPTGQEMVNLGLKLPGAPFTGIDSQTLVVRQASSPQTWSGYMDSSLIDFSPDISRMLMVVQSESLTQSPLKSPTKASL